MSDLYTFECRKSQDSGMEARQLIARLALIPLFDLLTPVMSRPAAKSFRNGGPHERVHHQPRLYHG